MLYFTMEIDPEAGGEYPQVNTASFVGSMISAWEWPSAPALQKLAPRLDAAAVQTDILSEAATSAFGFLVSRKVKTFLADFTLMGHRYFDCPVEGDAPELEHYTWLHLLDPRLVHQLDYQRSSFVEEDYFDEVETIEITSFEHYQALKAEDADATFGVSLKEIHSQAGTPAYDMFAVLPFTDEVLVSQRLRDAFLAQGLTGVEFNEAESVSFAAA